MSYVKLEFPVLVQKIKINDAANYHLRPIFLPNSTVTNRRYENALTTMENLVARRLKGMELTRENTEYILWHFFNPDHTFYSKRYTFKVGKDLFDGLIGVVRFELKGLTFVCLPSFNHYLFIARTNPNDKTAIDPLVERAARSILKDLKKQEEDLDCADFYLQKGAFITTIRKSVRVKPSLFHFERTADTFFFANTTPSDDFDGGTEIEKVGNDLNQLYPNNLVRAFYRADLVQRLTTTIYQSENTPIVLVGKEGVGKHSIIQEVVWQYIAKHKNQDLDTLPKVWFIDPTRIISGMSYVGWWQKRFEAILDFVQNRRKKLYNKTEADKIVFDNVVALLRIGRASGSNMTLSDVLKPYIEKRQVQVILVATPEEWKIVQEKDRRFSDLFQVLRIEEADLEESVKMVLAQRKLLEIEHACTISIQAIQRLFTIQRNYLKNKALPGSVMKLLRQIAVKYRFSEIDLPEIREEFRGFSGLEEAIFDPTYSFTEGEVRKTIAAQLVGQTEAVDTLADVVHTIKAKLTTPNKPLASFLFIGPTGVGKTQAAKVLSTYLMGDEKQLLRFDMNEYIDAGAVHRLIGDYDNPEGQLTGKVRYNPFGVLLLDEIEKAHPAVHDLLLQVLDDGRLTDSVGRTVYFNNLIIIMTSNVGAREVASQVGFGSTTTSDAAIFRKAVETKFRPEFVNRIDRIVIFKPLAYEHILNIARLQIKELLQRDGFVRRSTILNISQEALEWVAKRGFDERMGGRALKRQIEKDLTSLSADQLVSTYSDQPILFDIDYDGTQLIPKINLLEFATPITEGWMPRLPDQRQGKRFYGDLLRRLEDIERQISRLEQKEGITISGAMNKDSLNWQHYHFKERVSEVKERVQLMLVAFRDRYFRDAPVIPLRLKRIKGSFFTVRKDKGYKEMMRDQFFQEKALQELTDETRYAPSLFDNMETQFIDNFLNVFILEYATKGFLQQQRDHLLLRIETAAAGIGKEETTLIVEQYKAIFEMLDISFKVNAKLGEIEIDGFGLYDLLIGEEGIHLFHGTQQAMTPIRVTLQRIHPTVKRVAVLKVIRVYNSGNTLIDLRTGFTNALPLTPHEFKLLLYAGVKSLK